MRRQLARAQPRRGRVAREAPSDERPERRALRERRRDTRAVARAPPPRAAATGADGRPAATRCRATPRADRAGRSSPDTRRCSSRTGSRRTAGARLPCRRRARARAPTRSGPAAPSRTRGRPRAGTPDRCSGTRRSGCSASAERWRGSASRRVRPLSTRTMCSSAPGRGPVTRLVYAEIGWPVALRASRRRNTARSASDGTSFSMPRQAMCTRARLMPRSALPSLVTTTSVPRLGDREVRAGDRRVGGEEARAQVGARDLGEPARVGLARGRRELAREQLADVGARPMDRRHDDVRGRLVGELHDPLAEVGVDHLDAAASRGAGSARTPPSASTCSSPPGARRARARISSTTPRSSAASSAQCTRAPALCAAASKRSRYSFR